MRTRLADEADQGAEVVVGIGTGRGQDHGVEVLTRRGIGGIEAAVAIGIGDVTDPEAGIRTVIGSEVIGAGVAEVEENLPGGNELREMCTIWYDRRESSGDSLDGI